MADATVFAAHKEHGLGHDFMQFHGVVARATGHDKARHTHVFQGLFPARLPLRRARCCGCSERCFTVANKATSVANFIERIQHVFFQGVALRIFGRAHVHGERAFAWHHIDRTIGHLELSNGGHGIAVCSRAFFHVQGQFGHCASSISPAVHGRGACVTGHAHHFAHITHAAIDGTHNP